MSVFSSAMHHAVHQAQLAQHRGEVPVGAIITDQHGNIIAAAGNMVEQLHDPSAHAELLAMRQAAQKLGETRLTECDLYVTLEPCPMCAAAIGMFRIRRVYFGAYDVKGGGIDHGPRIFETSPALHKPEIYGGIMEDETSQLLKKFFAGKRG